MKRGWLKLLGFILVSYLAGFIGGIFTQQSVTTWYLTLQKPVFNPPSWVFGPVWTSLYILMGIAAFLVYNKGYKKARTALNFFFIQLFFNALWSFLFFGLKNPLLAFIEIIILWSLILVTTYYFYKVEKKAAYLMLPYLLWVSFATVLNFSLYILN